jgi:hypothetical protein
MLFSAHLIGGIMLRFQETSSIVGICSSLIILYACSSSKVVLNEFTSIADGKEVAYKVIPGMYRLELTSASDGAVVKWAGATCPPSEEVTSYETLCELSTDGQLIVRNPTRFGNGPSISVTLKLTKLR